MTAKFETHITPGGRTSLKPAPATRVDEAIAYALEIARQKNLRVILTFNKQKLFINSGSDPETVQQKYYEALAKHPRRTRRPAF